MLVADSYEDARSPIVRYLDRCGFEVVEAASADEAAELIRNRKPQAVLSGLTGAESVRLQEILAADTVSVPRIVIAMLSGGEESIPSHATGVLTKPFSLRPMLDELRRELQAAADVPSGS